MIICAVQDQRRYHCTPSVVDTLIRRKSGFPSVFHESGVPSPRDRSVTCVTCPSGALLVVAGGLTGGVANMSLPQHLSQASNPFFPPAKT